MCEEIGGSFFKRMVVWGFLGVLIFQLCAFGEKWYDVCGVLCFFGGVLWDGLKVV
jgi:hypothetical protein